MCHKFVSLLLVLDVFSFDANGEVESGNRLRTRMASLFVQAHVVPQQESSARRLTNTDAKHEACFDDLRLTVKSGRIAAGHRHREG